MSLWLVRHGETEWSRSGRHTGRTDLPLTREGELQALALGRLLEGRRFGRVLASPRRRALDSARLAGFGERATTTEAIVEVDYGEYEGLTTPEIWSTHPGWELFRNGSPGGESPPEIRDRVDAVLHELEGSGEHVALFGHGHCFRALAARFLGLPIEAATQLRLDAGSISILSRERDGPAVLLWNRRVPPRAVLVADLARRVPEAPG